MENITVIILLAIILILFYKVFQLERRTDAMSEAFKSFTVAYKNLVDKFVELANNWNNLVNIINDTEQMDPEEIFGDAFEKYEDSLKEYFELREKNLKEKNIDENSK